MTNSVGEADATTEEGGVEKSGTWPLAVAYQNTRVLGRVRSWTQFGWGAATQTASDLAFGALMVDGWVPRQAAGSLLLALGLLFLCRQEAGALGGVLWECCMVPGQPIPGSPWLGLANRITGRGRRAGVADLILSDRLINRGPPHARLGRHGRARAD